MRLQDLLGTCIGVWGLFMESQKAFPNHLKQAFPNHLKKAFPNHIKRPSDESKGWEIGPIKALESIIGFIGPVGSIGPGSSCMCVAHASSM